MNPIRALVNLPFDRENPHAFQVYRILRRKEDYSKTDDPILARECDKLFERRWKVNRVAYRMSFWSNHYEIPGVERSGLAKPGINILDFGCGTGNIAIELARRGYTITGIDISPKAIAIANMFRDDLPSTIQNNVHFICANIHTFEADKPYELIIMLHVIEHIEDPTSIFESIWKVASDDAKIWISVPLGHHYDDPSHVYHFASPEELEQHLQRFGTVLNIRVDTEKNAIRCTLGR